MQFFKIRIPFTFLALIFISISIATTAQVSSVDFGKNRIQYKKFNWRFYQSPNFNIHFTEGGLDLAKFVLLIAEQELPNIETFTESALQYRANIVLYNTYDDARQSNIGLGINLPENGGTTQLVNNKILLYFNSNHADLRRQVREGIARILVENKLMGENLGEIASNAALLDLPKWLTDGYISYVGENWNVEKDDALKNQLLANNYRNFYQLAHEYPTLAGHAFWNFIANNYKKENVTYFLYLAIIYKNLNSAANRIARKKFKDLLAEFMEKETDKYYADIKGRRNYPKGSISITEDVNKDKDFYHFAPNPNPRSYTYAVAEYKKGFYTVSLYENYVNRIILVKNGVRQFKHERNPLYPVMSWDGKGQRLAVVYWKEGQLSLLVWDLANNGIIAQRKLPFEQVQDAQYYLDNKRLIISGVKNGQSDIYVYHIDNEKLEQVTNDIWDDLDASFVSFPNKYGIIFSSNRPSAEAIGGDSSAPSDYRFNVFLVDANEKGGFRQVTQLTKSHFGNARFPTQYNMNHFTYVTNENGIGNRYAGFFTTKAEGLDTLVVIGEEILRNPSLSEIDSTLKAWERTEPDSIGFIALTKDSTYTFPITNYQSSLLESRIAGDKGQVSEVTQQSDYKMLYRLRVDSITLRKRNVSSRPTEYIRQLTLDEKRQTGAATYYSGVANSQAIDTSFSFLGEFTSDSTKLAAYRAPEETPKNELRSELLKQAKLHKYRLRFNNDQITAGLTNSLILNRYQPYMGGAGPIYMNNGNSFSWLMIASLSDVMEDYRITGGIKPGGNFTDNEYFLDFQNYRKRLDWGLDYYRAANSTVLFPARYFPNLKMYTNRYQVNVSYPLNEIKSIRVISSLRTDRVVTKADYDLPETLTVNDTTLHFANLRAEFVHDNTLVKEMNIWNGLRWKLYADNILQLDKASFSADVPAKRQFTFNLGADFRYYYPIYRNFIWAARGAADLSWGNQKLIYYLGGVDNWMSPKFTSSNPVSGTNRYIYQSLAVQMRGYNQNLAHGNNAMVFNSEFRLPVFSTLLNRPINNAFLRNFQVVQFLDLGTAWEGGFDKIKRPGSNYSNGNNQTIIVSTSTGGIGPFSGGYGFGVRSTLFGYFVKADAAWTMNGFFANKPIIYIALGLDF